MSNKFMYGSPILLGSSTTPGVQIPPELKKVIPDILKSCTDFGLDYYPPIIQMLTHDEMSEVASYGGFGVRYPHWKWGMEYEEMQRGYMHGMHKIYEMVVNCCFSATQVVTKQFGSKPIKDVVVGEDVLSANGWRKVVLLKKQKESKTLRINLNEIYNKTICTPNHKWKCLRNGFPEWVEAKDIVAGDMIMAGGNYQDFLGKPAILNWNSNKVTKETAKNIQHRLKPIFPKSEMTVHLAELLGVITGDGTLGTKRSSNNILVAIHKPLEDYKKHVANLFEKSLGIVPAIHKKKKSIDNVVVCSKLAVDFFDTIGFKKGCTYKTKRVPWSIWQSSNEFRAAYLRGFFDTDGYCGKYLSASCFSDELASDIQLLLLEMGIRSKYKRVINKNNNIAIITIKGKRNIRLFQKLIGFSLGYKSERLQKLSEISSSLGHGQKMNFFNKRIFDVIDMIKDQPDWMYRFRRTSKELSSNAYWNFLNRCIENDYLEFSDLFNIANTPLYEVFSVEEDAIQETYDIALDHDDHDFLANGLVSHNTNPCYIYCLNSNTLLDNVTVIAHALGHSHFFKNNLFFQHTNKNMLNEFANHGTRIRRYMSRWGKERVIEFIDHVLRIETLVDNAKVWNTRQVKEPIIRDHRKYRQPRRMQTDKSRMYMDDWINTKDFVDAEHKRIEKADKADELGLMLKPEKDIFGWIRENANLKPWQSDIMAMLYEEAMYYAPQGMTKCCNEAFASWIDYKLIAEQGLCALGQEAHDHGIVEYAKHKMGVLGGKYSTNPYKLGFSFLMHIEEKWNKGMFGNEWENVTSYKEKEIWDKKLGLGKEKVFEVVRLYDDVNLINEYFDQDFCDKYQFFDWQKQENGEYVVQSKDANVIKRKLIEKYSNRGLPTINLVDNNHLGKGIMLLEHVWNGRTLYIPYVNETLGSINFLTGRPVLLASKNKNGEEIVFYCEGFGDSQVHQLTRLQYKREFGISV